MMKACRECQHSVSEQALICPQCGAPRPASDTWDGWGFEYQSKTRLFGLPVLHISLKYRSRFAPVPAKGIIAIGQFAIGVVSISQFGVGLFSISQFTLAGFAIAQFGVAYSLVAQFGLYLGAGTGQAVMSVFELLALHT